MKHQLQDIGADETCGPPDWVADTVSTVNLLQQRIARDGWDGPVLQACLRDAADHWNEILKDRGISVRAEVANHLWIDKSAIVTLAVVGQELIARAAKHAFEDEHLGVISLRLSPVGPDTCELSVADDGAKAMDVMRRWRGLSIVRRLVESLAGTCEVCCNSHGRGTMVRIVFPIHRVPRNLTSDIDHPPKVAATVKGRGPLSGRKPAGQ